MNAALAHPHSGGVGQEAETPPLALAVHCFPVRVYYEDTDAAGIVYYANYLKFAERARTEYLREAAPDIAAELAAAGMAFAVRRCVADYATPSRLDDLLLVKTSLTGIRGACLYMEQLIRGDDDDGGGGGAAGEKKSGNARVRLSVQLALVGPTGRPARIPATLRAAFEKFSRLSRR